MTQKLAPKLVFQSRVDPRNLLILVEFYQAHGLHLAGKSSVVELALRDFSELLVNKHGYVRKENVDEALAELEVLFPGANFVNRKSLPSIAYAALQSETDQERKNSSLDGNRAEEFRKMMEGTSDGTVSGQRKV